MTIASTDAKTIKDFGEQWTRFPEDNTGYYASKDFLADILNPLITPGEIKNSYVAEIGAGTGRIVKMLVETGAGRVLALEPSDAVGPLRRNVTAYGDKVEVVHGAGHELPARGFDYVITVGVMQHVSEPIPVLKAALNALRPGGKFFMWLYAKEGTEMYRAFVMPVRSVTRVLPHPVLNGICWTLGVGLNGYIQLCKLSKYLPLSKYMTEVLGKVSNKARVMTIYDQLNPTWVRYYTRQEVESMMREAGFADVKAEHRHGYSWAVVGTRR
jgi:SAM-dependent methyltransferase